MPLWLMPAQEGEAALAALAAAASAADVALRPAAASVAVRSEDGADSGAEVRLLDTVRLGCCFSCRRLCEHKNSQLKCA